MYIYIDMYAYRIFHCSSGWPAPSELWIMYAVAFNAQKHT